MAEKEKVTIMILDVDLQCSKCYKKVKKVLCKFPQIRDQVYDEKNNKVIIKVVCCSPEKLRDKLCCKGGGSIKRIEIKEPEKPKPPPPKEPEKPNEPEKPKQPEKPKEPEKPKQPEKPKVPEKPKQPEKPKEPEKPKQPEKPKTPEKPKEPEKPKPPPAEPPMVPVCYPPAPPMGTCCSDCYNGRRGGPCEMGWAGAPQFEYGGYCGRPVYDSWGGGGYRGCYDSRQCVNYFSEENPQGCSIM